MNTIAKSNVLKQHTKELLNINSVQSTLSLLPASREHVDEYGFIILTPEEEHERQSRLWKNGLRRLGRGYHCKDLCILLPRINSRQISHKKTGLYYCARCEIAMKCHRCRCCGSLGRMEPRQRIRLSHPDTKFIE